jgi:glycosyltransferase involved in cell wall biosynthesis
MYVPLKDKEQCAARMKENLVSDILLSFIKDGHVFMDIGAEYGFYSLTAASKARAAKIVSVEPGERDYELLELNAKLNGFDNIKTHNCGVVSFFGSKETASLGKIDFIVIGNRCHILETLGIVSELIRKNRNLKLLLNIHRDSPLFVPRGCVKLVKKLHELKLDVFLAVNGERRIFRIANPLDLESRLKAENQEIHLLCINREESLFVAFLSHYADMYGAERSLLELIDGLVARGVLCHVVLPSHGSLEKEIQKRAVSYELSPLPWWTYNDEEEIERVREQLFSASSDLLYRLKKINPHLIYTNTILIGSGAIVAWLLKKPHVWHIREFADHFKFLFGIDEMKRFISNYSDKLLFVSHAQREYYSVDPRDEKYETVYNNIKIKDSDHDEIDSFFRRGDSLKLLILGTIHPQKRQMDAVSAVTRLVKMDYDIELAVVGRANRQYLDKLKAYVRDEQLADRIHFIDHRDSVAAVILSTDILLTCSELEGFGRVAVEAMRFKKPVIGSRSGGTVEMIIDGYNGFLYELGNIDELSKRISFFYKNRDRIKEMGMNGYLFANEKFTEQNYSGRIFHILKGLKQSHREETNPMDETLYEMLTRQRSQIIDLTDRVKTMEPEYTYFKEIRCGKMWRLYCIYTRLKRFFGIG